MLSQKNGGSSYLTKLVEGEALTKIKTLNNYIYGHNQLLIPVSYENFSKSRYHGTVRSRDISKSWLYLRSN